MAHTPEEPAGHELVPMFDTLDVLTVYTSEGPVTHLVSVSTGQRLRIPTDSLPHLASLVLAEWQDHEPCDCCHHDEDDEDEWP